MADYSRSNMYSDSNMQIEAYYGPTPDFRSYSTSGAYYQTAEAPRKLKKGKSTGGSMSKSWSNYSFSIENNSLSSELMAAPLLRAPPLLLLRLVQRSYHLSLINVPPPRRPLCTSAADSTGADGGKSPSLAQVFQSTDVKDRPHFPKLDDTLVCF